MERPRRLLAVAAATLALAGCADRAGPSTGPSSQILDIICATTPSDTRTFPPYSLDLYRCADMQAKLPTRRILLSKEGVPLVSFFPTSPKGENERYSDGKLIGNRATGECVIVAFDTQGYQFTEADVLPCPPSDNRPSGIHV